MLQSLEVWVYYQGWKTLHWAETVRQIECFQTLQSVRTASVVCKKAKQFSWFLTYGDRLSLLEGSFLLLTQAGAVIASASAARRSLSYTNMPKEEGTFERLFLRVSGKQRGAVFCIHRRPLLRSRAQVRQLNAARTREYSIWHVVATKKGLLPLSRSVFVFLGLSIFDEKGQMKTRSNFLKTWLDRLSTIMWARQSLDRKGQRRLFVTTAEMICQRYDRIITTLKLFLPVLLQDVRM